MMASTTKILYRIEHSPELGRYLVAAEDIQARSQIIYEQPLVWGSADDDREFDPEEIPTCLGCARKMKNCPWNRCGRCGWPVCSKACESPVHEMECGIFKDLQFSYPPRHTWPIINKTVLVLRTLLLQLKNPSAWSEVILQLEHHSGIRQAKPYCQKGDEMILENFKDFFRNGQLSGGDWSEEIITRISGVINVNAFSSSKSGKGGSVVQCVFPQASLLVHCCVPNCNWTVNEEHSISVRTAVPIRKGEMISIAYSQAEICYGTLHRLVSMEDVAHFACRCRRCQDPTEFGTFVSAVKCFDCEEGWLLPVKPTEAESEWKCEECPSLIRVRRVVRFLNEIEEELERIKNCLCSRQDEVLKLEELLNAYGGKLHENHYIFQEIRMKIIKLQWSVLDRLEGKEVEEYVGHCRILLGIADVLNPGFSKIRALLQFFLSQGLLRLKSCTELSDRDAISPDNFINDEDLNKEIYYLQTRALLYFNDLKSNHSVPSQFIKCIQNQMKTVERQIN